MVSLRTRNFNTDKLKVNDQRGNPTEIAAVVVWRVQDTAQAAFDVDNYLDYVHVQSESALRYVASRYPYDTTAENICIFVADHLVETSGDVLRKRRIHTVRVRVSETETSYAQTERPVPRAGS